MGFRLFFSARSLICAKIGGSVTPSSVDILFPCEIAARKLNLLAIGTFTSASASVTLSLGAESEAVVESTNVLYSGLRGMVSALLTSAIRILHVEYSFWIPYCSIGVACTMSKELSSVSVSNSECSL